MSITIDLGMDAIAAAIAAVGIAFVMAWAFVNAFSEERKDDR